MQNIFEEKSDKSTANSDDKENSKNKKKSQDNARDSMPPLTISESRRNLGMSLRNFVFYSYCNFVNFVCVL